MEFADPKAPQLEFLTDRSLANFIEEILAIDNALDADEEYWSKKGESTTTEIVRKYCDFASPEFVMETVADDFRKREVRKQEAFRTDLGIWSRGHLDLFFKKIKEYYKEHKELVYRKIVLIEFDGDEQKKINNLAISETEATKVIQGLVRVFRRSARLVTYHPSVEMRHDPRKNFAFLTAVWSGDEIAVVMEDAELEHIAMVVSRFTALLEHPGTFVTLKTKAGGVARVKLSASIGYHIFHHPFEDLQQGLDRVEEQRLAEKRRKRARDLQKST